MSGDPSDEVPVGASRGLYSQCTDERNGVPEDCPTRPAGTVAPADAGRSAAADLPGLRPFRRGSWSFAQTCPTQRRPEAKRLKRWTQSSRTQRRPEETHLHLHGSGWFVAEYTYLR